MKNHTATESQVLARIDSLLSILANKNKPPDDNQNKERSLTLVDSLFGLDWKLRKKQLLTASSNDNDKKCVIDESKIVKMVAPMVRYSKLPFRMLCRKWGCNLAFTPMIIADSFNRSSAARDSEFFTSSYDKPLIVQFASNNPIVFAQASLKVMKYCNGVDINCGCPQSWAIKEHIGAYLINKPEIIKNIIYETCKLTQYKLPISYKIRIHSNINKTIDFVKQIQSINASIGAKPFEYNPYDNDNGKRRIGGLSWLTVHGRTLSERTKVSVHLDHIRTIVEHSNIPIIANGDVNLPKDILNTVKITGCQGVMCARGILSNPALFKGYDICPIKCITDYISLALQYGGHFSIHHHHLMYMINNHLTRSEQRDFNSRNSMCSVIDFLSERHWLPDDVNQWQVNVPNDIFN